jgi:poly(hydroxyalkanoate) depolymerase family esterase
MHATALVRSGNLADATREIQRALVGAGMPAHGGAAPAPASRPGGGRFLADTYANSAGARTYKTYLPPRPVQGLPAVVMLHGCKQHPDDFAAGTRMNALADELGFVVVYPAQSGHANVSCCWNWFQPQHQRRDAGEPSLIAGITREVAGRHELDLGRVYVAGLSAGGAMAAIMASTYPELYAAAGIHSGLAHAAASDLPSAFAAMRNTSRAASRAPQVIPMIVFHGDRDTTVHPSNGEHASVGTLERVEKGHANGRAYTRTMHLNEEGQTVLEHWLVHGAGHAWSGGSSSGSFADPRGPDASREMLRFFGL